MRNRIARLFAVARSRTTPAAMSAAAFALAILAIVPHMHFD